MFKGYAVWMVLITFNLTLFLFCNLDSANVGLLLRICNTLIQDFNSPFDEIPLFIDNPRSASRNLRFVKKRFADILNNEGGGPDSLSSGLV